MKLNIGCGDLYIKDFVNLDMYNPHADIQCDAKKLAFKENSIDEIYASHIIEHFDYFEAFDVLEEWRRVLKKEGVLVIETPDLLASCKKFVETDNEGRISLYSHFFAKPWVKGEVHKFLYTPNQMRWILEKMELRNICQANALRYIGLEDISMKFICQK